MSHDLERWHWYTRMVTSANQQIISVVQHLALQTLSFIWDELKITTRLKSDPRRSTGRLPTRWRAQRLRRAARHRAQSRTPADSRRGAARCCSSGSLRCRPAPRTCVSKQAQFMKTTYEYSTRLLRRLLNHNWKFSVRTLAVWATTQ